jgi:signal transduction histidine kinase
MKALAEYGSRWGLRWKLVASYASLGALVTLLSLLAGYYVHERSQQRRAEEASFRGGTQQLQSLVASASEEGFSYVVSGDAEEAARFMAKIASARVSCEGLLVAPRLSESERTALWAVVASIDQMRDAGLALFEGYERTRGVDSRSYQAYENGIDGAWDAVAALDVAGRAHATRDEASVRRTAELLTLGIGALAVVVAIGWGLLFGHGIARPLIELRDAVRGFGEGRYDVPVGPKSGGEVGDLARAFERMRRAVVQRTRELEASHAETVRAHETLQANQRALITAEKMAAIGRLTAGIAHELNSPLAAIIAIVDDLKRLTREYAAVATDPRVSPADALGIGREMEESLEIVQSAADRAATFVRSIRSQTRLSEDGAHERFAVEQVVQDAINLTGFVARAVKCRLSLRVDADAELEGSPSRLGQAVTNLLQNAVDATAERGGGKVAVAVTGDDDSVFIRVTDTAGGIPTDVLPRIFEPLYTTKPYGCGTGLGLAIVKEVVGEWGGRVEVDTVPGAGSTFSLCLPKAKSARRAA